LRRRTPTPGGLGEDPATVVVGGGGAASGLLVNVDLEPLSGFAMSEL
jgi:hypothetical protein